MKILVGTDVTDNYVMIVGTDESKFEANKEIIDAIWGSFEMWSLGG
jgi:general stress protein 26